MPSPTRTLEKLANQIAGSELGESLDVEAWTTTDSLVESFYILQGKSDIARDYREEQSRSELNKVLSHLNEKEQRGEELSDQEKETKNAITDAIRAANASSNSNPSQSITDELRESRQESLAVLAGEVIDPEPIDTDNAQIVNGAKQCFLLYNMNSFAQFHQEMLAGLRRPGGRRAGSPTPAFYRSAGTTGNIATPGYYSNVTNRTRIYLAGAGTTNLANKLYLKKHAAKVANMKTAEAAQLVPRLRIFRQYLNKREGEQPTRAELVEFEFPPAFDPTKGITQQTQVDYLGVSENKFLRGMDIGVKSFNWNFIGSDPFTATREVEAELKLFAQSFPAFIVERQGRIITGGFNISRRKYRFVDLVLVPDCRNPNKREKNYKNFSPECYEIRVEVGYNGGDKTFGTFKDDGEFKEAINCHTDILSLVPQSHSFEYGDDGSVSLNIKLRGRLDAIMTDKGMNVLLPLGGVADTIKVNTTDLSRYLGKKPPYTLTEIDSVIGTLREKKPPESFKEIIEELETIKRKVILSSKQFFTSHIYDRLEDGGAIFNYTMSPAENAAFLNWQTKNTKTLPPEIQISDVVAGAKSGTIPGIVDSIATNQDTQEALTKLIDNLKNDPNAITSKEQIAYMFLGDLIAVVTDSIVGDGSFAVSSVITRVNDTITGLGLEQNVRTNLQAISDATTISAEGLDPTTITFGQAEGTFSTRAAGIVSGKKTAQDIHKNLRIILGNIKVSLKRPNGPKEIDINLADIPVSVEFFLKFMADNVLSKDILDYPYFHFMNDLIAAVVGNMLGTECFGGLTDASVRAQTLVINSNKDISTGNFYDVDPDLGYKVVDLSKITPENNLVDNCGDASSRANLFEYFVISVSIIDDKKLNGKYDPDIKQGIYHLAYGLDRGLVRSIKFNKTNQEFLPEARFASEGGLLLNQLSNAYDVTVEMVGSNLFRIGQLVYIDAEVLGAGPSWADTGEDADRKRSWANIMGLGGYHLITEVGNSITSDGTFVTTIKARWQSGGSRERWDL
jgi:hypothetical protein